MLRRVSTLKEQAKGFEVNAGHMESGDNVSEVPSQRP